MMIIFSGTEMRTQYVSLLADDLATAPSKQVLVGVSFVYLFIISLFLLFLSCVQIGSPHRFQVISA